MKRILFNATHPEELRVAVVDGQRLLDLDLESAVRSQKKGNIYKGTVTRVEPSLEAAFIDYGSERHGFLPFKEIYRGYFQNYSSNQSLSSVNIKDVIKEGQELIVQVGKDERGNKGAALTTFISLAGRFLVLMPNNPKGGGISRRITGRQRSELKNALDTLDIPSSHALIARTAAIGRTAEELNWDLEFLVDLWTAIEGASTASAKGPMLIYQESNLVVRTIRDSLSSQIQELVIDDKEIYERAIRFVKQVMPHNASKIKLYEDTTPLFSRYQIENQIESAFSREVRLRSGGAIVIDHTEALIAVDVNSARATKGGDIEETALQTNLEAAEEIARQLRVRDLGGLIVLDLIDMHSTQNQRKVENQLKESLRIDRARVQVGRISQFGMLEMSRQRLRSSIGDANYHTCPRCEGTGHIRGVVSSSLNLLRLIEEEAIKENTESIQVFLPLPTATYILNEKRRELAQLEARVATRILVIPTDDLETPHFQIKRLRSNEIDEIDEKPSYDLEAEIDREPNLEGVQTRRVKPEQPAIGLDQMTHATPPPTASNAEQAIATPDSSPQRDSGFFKRVWGALTGAGDSSATAKDDSSTDKQPPAPTDEKPAQKRTNTRNNQQQRNSGGSRSNNANRSGNRNNDTSSNTRRRPPRRKTNARRNPPNQNQNQNQNQGNQKNQQDTGTGSNAASAPTADNKTTQTAQKPRPVRKRRRSKATSKRTPREPRTNTTDNSNRAEQTGGDKAATPKPSRSTTGSAKANASRQNDSTTDSTTKKTARPTKSGDSPQKPRTVSKKKRVSKPKTDKPSASKVDGNAKPPKVKKPIKEDVDGNTIS